MKVIKQQIPNIITLLNLFSGCMAIIFIANFKFDYAFYAVVVGIFFDFFDGFFARKFGVSGPLGVQLDSLADMVTCGVVPGLVMVHLLNGTIMQLPIVGYFPYFGFLITLGSCYRLAKFNIDTRQSDSFIGLPTPANALFITSLPFFILHNDFPALNETLFTKASLVFITVASTFIMNAEIPLFSLKIKKMTIKDNLLPFSFLLFSVLLLAVFKYAALPVIILSYILVSIAHRFFAKR
jgi:CDP-diacylglycerol---serine O-phosphatidyltransferase